MHVSPREHVATTWGLSAEEAGSLAGDDLPALERATGVLVTYLRPEALAHVVRRPAERLGGRSLLELALAGEGSGVETAVRAMFDFEAASRAT